MPGALPARAIRDADFRSRSARTKASCGALAVARFHEKSSGLTDVVLVARFEGTEHRAERGDDFLRIDALEKCRDVFGFAFFGVIQFQERDDRIGDALGGDLHDLTDRKSTRLNSS